MYLKFEILLQKSCPNVLSVYILHQYSMALVSPQKRRISTMNAGIFVVAILVVCLAVFKKVSRNVDILLSVL